MSIIDNCNREGMRRLKETLKLEGKAHYGGLWSSAKVIVCAKKTLYAILSFLRPFLCSIEPLSEFEFFYLDQSKTKLEVSSPARFRIQWGVPEAVWTDTPTHQHKEMLINFFWKAIKKQ